MARIAETIEVMDGRGTVYRHEGEDKWRYREFNTSKRSYRTGLISGATTKEEAIAKAFEVVLKWNNTEPVKKPRTQVSSVSKGPTIEDEVKDFLRQEERLVMADEKDDQAHLRRRQSMDRMLNFLEVKEVTKPSQITATTFIDYSTFRISVSKNTRKTELKDISVFIRTHLRRKGLITNELAMEPDLLPKIPITDDDLDANPAISQRDYDVINKFIRTQWRDSAKNHKGVYFRRHFHCLVHLLWNSGMRPSELLAIKMKDITITNPKRWSESKQEFEDDYKLSLFVRKSKNGKKRDVLLTSNAADNLMEFRKFQSDYLRTHKSFTITPESLLFGKPDEFMEKTFNFNYYDQTWRQDIINPLVGQLEGNRFSDKPYTLYSLRSSFIEKQIVAGLDVYFVARLVGNTVKTIQKHYDRHDVLKRADEVQHIERGRTRRPEVETIDVLSL